MVIYELTNTISKIIQNSDAPHFEAELIVMSALKLDRAKYLISKTDKADEKACGMALEMADRRKAGEPLAYILGKSEFMGMEFIVNRDTLIPRQDTECVVEFAAALIGDKPYSVIDIGTGSGCIGISIGKLCKNTSVTLLDINRNALDTAAENARLNGVKVDLLCADILNDTIDRKFNAVISNPPYIKTEIIKTLQTEVKDFEPVRALDGGSDGLLFYRRICEILPGILNKNGIAVFETGYDQREAVCELVKNTGLFKTVGAKKDLAGNDRLVYGI